MTTACHGCAAHVNASFDNRRSRTCQLVAIKAFHSFAFFVIQSAILYLLYTALRGQSDRRAALAAAIATGESLVYAGNGFRCPLTGMAEKLGAEHGSVTDIFLPKWLASNIARIYTPLFLGALILHAKNLRRRTQLKNVDSVGGKR